jgi:hypothetical protein
MSELLGSRSKYRGLWASVVPQSAWVWTTPIGS